MPTIRRKSLPKHILIPDTNVLWHENKDMPVSPDFSDFWENYGLKYEIDLYIPEVVRGELLYQHTSSALKALERMNKQFNTISSIANKKYTHKVSINRVKGDIEKKLDSWISSVSAILEETPIAEIDWKKLIQNSIWRIPPFFEDQDKKNEKGFRDALILETVCYIADSNKGTNMAFVSADRLLLESAKGRLKTLKGCGFYQTLDEFSSYLRLLDEKLTNEFVMSVQTKAREKFHSEKKPSLIHEKSIIKYIKDNYSATFNPPVPANALARALSGSRFSVKESWDPISDEGIWIRPPSFVRIENKNEYIWDSKILFIQLFKYSGPGSGTLLTGSISPGQENIRKIEFKVLWRARVDRNARFRSTEIVETDFAEQSFEIVTAEDRDRYGLSSSGDKL